MLAILSTGVSSTRATGNKFNKFTTLQLGWHALTFVGIFFLIFLKLGMCQIKNNNVEFEHYSLRLIFQFD